MADNNLPTTTSSQSQSTTQSPQNSAAYNGYRGQLSSQVQPGTSTNVLTSNQGVPLRGAALPSVRLTASTQQTPPAATAPRHIHPVLFIFSFLLFVAAIALFWSASRSVNTTTK